MRSGVNDRTHDEVLLDKEMKLNKLLQVVKSWDRRYLARSFITNTVNCICEIFLIILAHPRVFAQGHMQYNICCNEIQKRNHDTNWCSKYESTITKSPTQCNLTVLEDYYIS